MQIKELISSNPSLFLIILSFINLTRAQENTNNNMDCYGSGSIAAAVLGTLVATVLLLLLIFYGYCAIIKARKEKHLILETDPEQGDKYAFDNPCFKDANTSNGFNSITKVFDKNGAKFMDAGKKFSHWSAFGTLVSSKTEKKHTLDDSYLEQSQIKTVPLRGHDFTGLGFNICGNIRDGIYIKDILNRGPASECGKLNPGDRINSVRISFEHMVYEDALIILSYASPYEVEIEAKSNTKSLTGSVGQGAQPQHPVYRSSSSSDLVTIGKSSKHRFLNNDPLDSSLLSDYSILQLSSNNTTLEKSSKLGKLDVNSLTKPLRTKKANMGDKHLTSTPIDSQNIQKQSPSLDNINISNANKNSNENIAESEVQKSEEHVESKNRLQKFGIRVLPPEIPSSRSPKAAELSQNDNNINQEKLTETIDIIPKAMGIDEVDKIKIRNEDADDTDYFARQSSITGSGIKRDEAGIPQEIPEHMFNAALAARKNRKSQEILNSTAIEEKENDILKTPKKTKGKAPAPPPSQEQTKDDDITENMKTQKNGNNIKLDFDEINTVNDEKVLEKNIISTISNNEEVSEDITIQSNITAEDVNKDYCSDSDMETDNQSSVNTIELNSSDITIHHSEQQNSSDIKGRKTASTGDLSKIKKGITPSTGTLERAQSLDITESVVPTLPKKRKATNDNLDLTTSSNESLYEQSGIKVKEPRLSLVLDGLDTFQRNRLKKSSEWGNLEDAVLKLDKVEVEDSPIKIKSDFSTVDVVISTNNDISIISAAGTDDKLEEEYTSKPEFESSNIQDNEYPSLTLTERAIGSPTFNLKAQFEEKLNTKLNTNDTEPISFKSDDKNTTTASLNIKSYAADPTVLFQPGKSSQNFIFAERYASNNDTYDFNMKMSDINISDDIKVSRHSLGSLERPKSDVLKNVNKLKMQNLISSDQGGISNVSITDASSNEEGFSNGYHILNKPVIENTDLHKVLHSYDSKRTNVQDNAEICNENSTPGIKNITITETCMDNVYISESPSSLTIDTSSDGPDSIKSNTLTFVTEIHVSTPNTSNSENSTDEVQISSIKSSSNINVNNDPPEVEVITTEESIKKLPEMKFTTSIYETPKTPEKRLSQIELLRSNFEKSPPKPNPKPVETSPTKSRIPVATTKIDFNIKPTPERREIKVGDFSCLDSSPIITGQTQRVINKPPSRNVTVTSIKSSKIPSESFATVKPPLPAKPSEITDRDTKEPENGTAESSFKQWVFNPSENSVTNIVINNNKNSQK